MYTNNADLCILPDLAFIVSNINIRAQKFSVNKTNGTIDIIRTSVFCGHSTHGLHEYFFASYSFDSIPGIHLQLPSYEAASVKVNYTISQSSTVCEQQVPFLEAGELSWNRQHHTRKVLQMSQHVTVLHPDQYA